jgi:hypothetical protein
MKLVLTRESVAAGDDADAPHHRTVEVDDRSPIELVITAIVDDGYLPSIYGGQATWVVTTDPVSVGYAVVAQQWDRPKMLLEGSRAIADLCSRLHFLYCAQDDPDEVAQVVASAPAEQREAKKALGRPLGLDRVPRHP